MLWVIQVLATVPMFALLYGIGMKYQAELSLIRYRNTR